MLIPDEAGSALGFVLYLAQQDKKTSKRQAIKRIFKYLPIDRFRIDFKILCNELRVVENLLNLSIWAQPELHTEEVKHLLRQLVDQLPRLLPFAQ